MSVFESIVASLDVMDPSTVRGEEYDNQNEFSLQISAEIWIY
ncbi:MAG: hypothetical protein ACI8TQ_003803 [Planctomycetota bacterium]|jgi:hypothetical protein